MPILKWSEAGGVAWHYTAPGKAQQNAFVESFTGRLRDECLNDKLFCLAPPGPHRARSLARRLQRRAPILHTRQQDTGGVPNSAHCRCGQRRNGQNLNPGLYS